MRAVTIAAADEAETHRMRGRLVEVRAFLQVTLVTDLGLGGPGKQRIVLRMQRVAIGTRPVVGLMGAADPADPGIALMAAQADLVTLGGRKERGLFETVYRVLSAGGGMPGARTVASLALQSCKGRALVGAVGMLGLEDPQWQ